MTRTDESDDFAVEKGDRVLVRVRERGTSGRAQGKFVGAVTGFRTGVSLTPDKIEIEPPWDGATTSNVALRPTDAEIEKVDGEVNF